MEEVVQYIPIPAWQQAAIVIIFVLAFLGILSWFAAREKNWQNYITALFDKILERDVFWQSWLEKQSLQSNQCMLDVTRALENLSDKIDAHDQHVEAQIKYQVGQIKEAKDARKAS
jgi:hypothetical protein